MRVILPSFFFSQLNNMNLTIFESYKHLIFVCVCVFVRVCVELAKTMRQNQFSI